MPKEGSESAVRGQTPTSAMRFNNSKRSPQRSSMMLTNRGIESPLKKLTHSTDMDNLTRKHQLAMNGHIGHGRNLT